MLAELVAWSAVGGVIAGNVSTVHFGGGTPGCLATGNLARLVAAIRQGLKTSPKTEWAIESTSSLAGAENLDQLQRLGFSRLHVGVQTLEDEVRRIIGRREPPATVVAKVLAAVQRGMVVSVDLVYGLPHETRAGLLDSIDRLADVGTHGFSLYQFQQSARNRRFTRLHASASDQTGQYALFEAAEARLRERGYCKNHFAHYSLPPDRNLYYRHAVRGEDLLSLGPSADGVFAGYHYRHAMLGPYVASATAEFPAFEGGVEENGVERALAPVSAALMSGRVAEPDLRGIDAADLGDGWRERSLVQPVGADGTLELTARGSWHLADMLDELGRRLAERRCAAPAIAKGV
jgi:oxygen-independent coproporphyrinogen-3 oxidase